MAIELPSKLDVLEPDVLERLASLEDPILAERLARENPELFPQAPPRTEREVLAWTTRRFGTAIIAVTAALAVAAGYFGNELRRGHADAPQTAAPRAAVPAPVPLRHASTAPRRRAASAHHAAPVAHHAIAQPAGAQPVGVTHRAAVTYVAPVPRPARAAHYATAAHHAVASPVPQAVRHHAAAPVVVHHTAPASAPRTAADQLAAWAATHPASRTHPRSEPSSSTEAATATSASTTNATTPASGPEPYPTSSTPRDTGAPSGAQRTPPTNPNGGWTERIPSGVLGGGIGPVFGGVPRDSCTPRGGRTGIVMEAIQILAAGRH
ncbi:MAG TPA: hypothetical protein VK669_00570 [Candidatus Limnocylindrales bacterium]|nr:hypothetical protein [Candidatus Limnocylindrales bacterium]